jgi:HK97 gp10 family phage protein
LSDTITITGLDDLAEMLTKIAPKAAKRYLSKCADPAAQVMLDAMDQTVPVDGGELREALDKQKKWGSEGDQTTMNITIGPRKGKAWGSMQEYGTKTQPAQHWMSNAWQSCKSQVLDVYVRGINDLMESMVARDQSEATLTNDDADRSGSGTSKARIAKDRKAAFRENNDRAKGTK